MKRILLTAALALTLAPSAFAQKTERAKVDGKVSITRLFNDAIVIAGGSTVALRYNSKSVSLGTIVSADGWIITKGSDLLNAMKKPSEDGLIVKLRDGTRHEAKVMGYHEATDLAIVKIDAKDLVEIKFVDSKFAEPGNMVAAPGMESEAVAAGVISAGVRKLYREEAVIDNANKGYLGVILAPGEDDKGVVIGSMEDGSPAKKAKLLVGDQIVSVEDRTIVKFDDLKKILGNYKPGDKVKVLVKRKKDKDSDDVEEMSFEVKLGTKSSFDRSAFQNSMGSELSGRRTGFPMVITHDMVLEPKDCGGPLVDLEGRVLGINIARAGRVETWALPPEVVKPIIAELKSGKHPLKQ
ncbi:PDZ domain-containing protein [soil metagenome]